MPPLRPPNTPNGEPSRLAFGVEGEDNKMKLSIFWIALSLVLTLDGHPATAVVPLVIWTLHRSLER
jgi:hypothetical protein